MDLQTAVKGMMAAREALRTKAGIEQPEYISQQMQRLTQYTGAVEEHLAQLEEELEIEMTELFLKYSQEKTTNQSEILARFETGKIKGEIAKLKRYVNSSWQIVGVAQSRWNHLAKSTAGQI